jgi:glycosyltransferase involved in cell wall biosynthesis
MAIMVSINCITYNHENFIKKCLNGFLSQKTNFEFEILVHDDASIDNTPNIIREYERKYPELIKPIIQNENQYSKGKSISANFNFPRAKGKYIAMCEGDDYWSDPLKLQKQFDLMEKNSNFSGCFHNTYRLCVKSNLKSVFNNNLNIILTKDLIKHGGGGLIDTCSLFFKKEILNRPSAWWDYLQLDQTLNLLISLNGPIIKINSTMAVYRTNQPNSWVSEQSKNLNKRLAFDLIELKMWKIFYNTEELKYKSVVFRAIMKTYYRYCYNLLLFILKNSIGSNSFGKLKNFLK